MERKGCGLGDLCGKFKPHLLMILLQLVYSILYFITEASFIHGSNPYVYVTYRNILAGLVLSPFAYFLERCTYANAQPKLTSALFLEICVLSFLEMSLSLNMYFASLKYTNPTFATVLYNTLASITFIIAVILRVEVSNLRSLRSIAKIVWTSVSLGGVVIVTLYRGPIIRNVWPPLIHIRKNDHIHDERCKGSLLAIASCISWALWYIMQAYSLKGYHAELSLTTWMCLVGGAQSAVFKMIMEHNKSAWTVGFNIDLLSVTCSASLQIKRGVVASGLFIFVQLWCTKEEGPVFVTMFNPLLTVLVAVLSYSVVGDKLHLGCIVGAIVVVIGLYLLIWGKEEGQEGDISSSKKRLMCNSDDPRKQDNLDLFKRVRRPKS
ncbi:WAT1-related protein At4g08300-like [Neltuma alba]|uniref:WAT1-related protein At4g08300-like n=1 Tax=Neltuma alba TaxID=207710 RepID=UPI0010A46AAE|nr:WAT1-related protein At4g08300-like [Prosopis alba]